MILGGLAFLLTLLATPAAAAELSMRGEQCICSEDGTEWACRRAIDHSTPITCTTGLNLTLKCPDDPKELCTWSHQPVCSEPRTILVCYGPDKPK